MENIKSVVAENIIKLRKQNNLTQAALAEKIHYSDKAVSRWENGEVMPDIETLNNIANVFNIEITAFFNKDLDSQKIKQKNKNKEKMRATISMLSVCGVWIIVTIVYVCLISTIKQNIWEIFIYALPISLIVAVVFSCLWGTKFWRFFFISSLSWALIISFYIMFLQFNIWPIFIIGVPMQIAILLWSRL